MFGFRKSPANKNAKEQTVSPGIPASSDNQSGKQQGLTLGRRTTSDPALLTPKSKSKANSKAHPWDDDDSDDERGASSLSARNNRSQSELEQMSVQELEDYAVDRSQETTRSVNNCLKIAEDIRQDATKTLETLHQQGEQIHRTHVMAADMDKDLSRGEKLLGSLGGMFSRTWKPKKTRDITGPLTAKDDNKKGKASKADREKLGLAPAPKGKSASRAPPPEPTNAMQKVELEKSKQDDALSDLSNVLDDLKGMAVDMGSELDSQNKALDHLSDDVDELNSRVKGANQRARKLLAK